jgi:predicted secreted protein
MGGRLSSMTRKSVHITPNSNQGGWNVKKSGAQRASVHTDTKAEAVKIGRIISQRSESELVIHGKDGKIQRSDSHGHDPYPPKDRK